MFNKEQAVSRLIEILVEFIPNLKGQIDDFSKDYFAQRSLLRGLMNMHSEKNPLPQEFFSLQDELLQYELSEKQLTDTASLAPSSLNKNIYVFTGDITSFKADAVVNSAEPNLLGCRQAGHNCPDNAIHSAAGLQLRFECASIMQGRDAPPGSAVATGAYNLPYEMVIHVVGPKVSFEVTAEDIAVLKKCYQSALKIAVDRGCKSVVFTPIATGTLGFSMQKVAKVAVDSVLDFLKNYQNDLKVIFFVQQDRDRMIYDTLLTPHEDKKCELHPFFNLNLF